MQKGQVIKAILLSLAVLGAVTIAVVAPNAIAALGPFMKKRNYNKNQINRGLKYLKQKKIIGIGKDKEGRTVIKLTEQGKERLIKYKLEDLRLRKPDRWDKKWRIVMFDIPEAYKLNRDTLTEKLKELGFFRLQKSAWLWPYPIDDEVEFLREVYEVRPFVKLITAESIEDPTRYLKHFDLK